MARLCDLNDRQMKGVISHFIQHARQDSDHYSDFPMDHTLPSNKSRLESIQASDLHNNETEETSCCGLRKRRRNEETRPLLHNQSNHSPSVADYESHDYDCYYSKAYKTEKLDTPLTKCARLNINILKWSLTFVIGFVTAIVALFIDYFTKLLTELKYTTVASNIDECMGDKGCLVQSMLMMSGFNVCFVIVAAVLVWIEPNAAGSGIPEIKCYLNGIKIPRVTRLMTLVSKACGVLFSVSGGLFVGKEGPMIHSGAVVGSGLPQFRSFTLPCVDCGVKTFRRDRDKRDFVSGGAAAGVAAAFGAPIGGVLFSLEEGSSFWNQELTWRTFFCAMAATFSLNFFQSGIKGFGWGTFYQPGLVNFGTFHCPKKEQNCHLWSAQDLFIFLCMGIVGGLLGALFNYINMLITVLRIKYLHPRHNVFRVLEVIVVALVTTIIAFVSAMKLGECRQLRGNNTDITADTRTYFCPDGYYNDMATLFFNPQEVAIKQLFHQDAAFSVQSLCIFYVFFFLLACWTYGIGVPSGLFVPSLLCGGAYGRLVATLLIEYGGYNSIYGGSFALIGSAAFLGGVVRMTISLTVILIESTNEITYGLPIMIVLMIAKWVGDLFNEGIYDMHIELKGVPFLGWDHPPGIDSLAAKDVMKTELCYIYPYTRVKSIYRMLKNSKHNAFPVVTIKKTPKDDANKGKTLSGNERFRQENTITRISEHRRRQDGKHGKQSTHGTQHSTLLSTRTISPLPGINLASDSTDPYSVPEMSISSSDEAYQPLRFHGMMLRSHIAVLMRQKIFTTDTACFLNEPIVKLSQDRLMSEYPRFHDIEDLNEADFADWMVLDVRHYMHSSPYTVGPETPLPQVFHLFRSMGLRHLPVVNCEGEIVGIITRHNLAMEALEEAKETTTGDPAPQDRTLARRLSATGSFRTSLTTGSMVV